MRSRQMTAFRCKHRKTQRKGCAKRYKTIKREYYVDHSYKALSTFIKE